MLSLPEKEDRERKKERKKGDESCLYLILLQQDFLASCCLRRANELPLMKKNVRFIEDKCITIILLQSAIEK